MCASADLPLPTAEIASRIPLITLHGPYGETRHVPLPVGFSAIKPHWTRGPQPLGSSPLAW
ncbi:hypothetical protein NDR87_36170 [Nocardia sp. CDC159]|uniref:Uncharacterized protein n=1 Tax=Nocardia pulmonis TaxID=2951408 RepID=A0A9X2EIM3_9NOCA|nr:MULTISPECIES: hypothetical protein [Nocardia]MCM6778933.1 hypothetical protein [Nocardia pulmonis]MCM6791814.1 hypothetical protein [Nocardia sp. CDC159]